MDGEGMKLKIWNSIACELRVAVHGSPPRLGVVRFLRA